uniref:Uncharacterized protein n=1 Tax=Araucaria cunninghamii TaxID=56994 RepID=A0A0D6RB13_ARACU
MKILRIIQCGRQTVRVIQPDGQVRQLFLPATVADLLRLHPHHYVREARGGGGGGGGGIRGGCILPPEAQLESGGIYMLLPLPRLFPSSGSAPPPLPSPCSCFARVAEAEEEAAAAAAIKCGPSIWTGRRHWGFHSCAAVSKISPAEWAGASSLRDAAGGGGKTGGAAVVKRSRLWEPSLEMILEHDDARSAEDDGGAASSKTATARAKKKERRQSYR